MVKYIKGNNNRVNNRWKAGTCIREQAVVWVAHGSTTDGNSLSNEQEFIRSQELEGMAVLVVEVAGVKG